MYSPRTEDYHINFRANDCTKILYNSRGKFNEYYKKWIYLVLLQAHKNFSRTYFSELSNANYVNLLINNILNEFESLPEEYPTEESFKTWLIPDGVIYKKEIYSYPIEEPIDIIQVLFDEIAYIRANYQMCLISEINDIISDLYSI